MDGLCFLYGGISFPIQLETKIRFGPVYSSLFRGIQREDLPMYLNRHAEKTHLHGCNIGT